MKLTQHDRILGCILGTAVGDAMGLPFENLSSPRRANMFGPVGRYMLVFGRGMGSDDTEHMVHVARALIHSGGEEAEFRQRLSLSLKAWFLCLPAGAGKATIIGCLRMLSGVPPDRSGVHSAGNGPAMRSALIGVMYHHDRDRMHRLVAASTLMTHSDPLALTGSMIVAMAAGSSHDPDNLLGEMLEYVADDDTWKKHLSRLRESLAFGESTLDFARKTCPASGVSGYIVQTVPVALHAALSTSTVGDAVKSAVECGGDTDTTAAIAGAICGARTGPSTIPEEWIDGWIDTPISIKYMRDLAVQLAGSNEGRQKEGARFAWWKVPPRNLVFLLILFGHIGRRLLPPYR